MSSLVFWLALGFDNREPQQEVRGSGAGISSGSSLDVPPLKTTALAKVALYSKFWKLLSPLSLQGCHYYRLQGTTLSFVVFSFILAHSFVNTFFSQESHTGLEVQ